MKKFIKKVPIYADELMGRFKVFLIKNETTILSLCSSVGVILTGVSASYATKKLYTEPEFVKKNSKLEKAKLMVSNYFPPLLIGTATIACIFGTNIISKKQQAAYMSAYTVLLNSFNDYRKKVNELYGDNTDEIIKSVIIENKHKGVEYSGSGEKIVFYEENYGDFFERSYEDVLLAEYHINRNLALRGYVSLNEFLAFLDLPPIVYGDVLGWDLNEGSAFYGYNWIDFCHKKYTLDDGLEYILIEEPFPPHTQILDNFTDKIIYDRDEIIKLGIPEQQLAEYA